MVFQRDIALEIGGYQSDYSPGEDVDFWNRIADHHTVLVIPEALIYYRIHGSAQTTNQVVRQFRNHARALINIRRRREGQPEYSQEELDALERMTPRGKRIRQTLGRYSQFYYRRGGSLLAAGKPSGLLWLLASAAAYPPLPLSRFKDQQVLGFAVTRLSAKVRSVLQPD
jgi:hypothetical protein